MTEIKFRCQTGTYRLLLNGQSRDDFHRELRKILDGLAILNKNSSDFDSGKSQSNKPSKMPTKISEQDSKLTLFMSAKSLFVFLSVVVKHTSVLKKK